MSVIVIKQTNEIAGVEVSAWFVRHSGKIHGQFITEPDACNFAMECMVSEFLQTGRPMDQYNMRQEIRFENNTAFGEPFPQAHENALYAGKQAR